LNQEFVRTLRDENKYSNVNGNCIDSESTFSAY
jgi:hypothetical protein